MTIFSFGTTFLLVCTFSVSVSPGIASFPPSTPNVAPVHSAMMLTPDEWQEIRTARAAALKANPQLAKNSEELSAKLREFQQKLDAAMLKTDPSLAPYMAGYSSRFHPTAMASPGHPANQIPPPNKPGPSITK